MATVAEVLAHQGGWDEALMIVTPLAIFVGLLWAAWTRAAHLADHVDHADGADQGDPPGPSGPRNGRP